MELDCEIQSRPTTQLLSVDLRHQLSTPAAIASGAQNYKVTLCSHNYYQITIGGFDITFFRDVLSMDHFQECFDWISSIMSTYPPLPEDTVHDRCSPSHTSSDAKNLGAPIDRLPPELMLEIVRSTQKMEKRLRYLVRLMFVCKRWYTLLDGTPFLWTSINASDGEAIISKALQRAKDSPLNIKFIGRTALTDRDTFFTLVGKRIGQWRSFTVLLTDGSQFSDFVFRDLERKMAPALEALILQGAYGMSQDMRRLVLFGGDPAPIGLKDLTLRHVAIDLEDLHLKGLKSLTLDEISGIVFDTILDTLRSSSLIEVLQLSGFEVLAGKDLHNPDRIHHKLLLPRLTHLSLKFLPSSFLGQLFSYIEIPCLRTFDLHCDLQDRMASKLLSIGLRAQVFTFQTMTLSVRTFTVTLDSGVSYAMEMGGLDMLVYIEVKPLSIDHIQEGFDWLSKSVGRSFNDIPLELEMDDCEPDLSYLEWFSHHTNVTKLTLLEYNGAELELIIPFLAQPTSSTPVTWLFPGLEALETNLVRYDGNPDILKMLERRCASREDTGVTAPRRLREIRLSYGGKGSQSYLNRNFLNEVVRIAEGADVYWEGQKWVDAETV
ncbi:hypothetical protein FRB90_006249 [Tulasnella sp. 427]|nr:hypothetical protein FRB90_006249 [Tulasnella sp. 427]